MLKTILKISVPIILIGIILFIGFNAYQKTIVSTENPITVIPTNASAILKINDVKNLNRNLDLTTLWEKLQNIDYLKTTKSQTDKISEFFNINQKIFVSNTLFISFHKVGANNSGVLFSTTFNRELITEDKDIVHLFGDEITTQEYDNKTIYYLEKTGMYYCFKGDILFFSDTKMLLTDAIRTSNENTDNLLVNSEFNSAYNTISNNSDINLMINYNHLFNIANTFSADKNSLTDFCSWTATDIKLKDKVFLANGIGTINNKITNYIDVFNGQKSNNIDVINLLPENTTEILAISFSNAKKIYDGKNKILQNQNNFWSWDKNRKAIQDSCNVNYNEFINEIDDEAGAFNTSSSLAETNKFTYFKVKESISATSLIQGLVASSTKYKEYQINKIKDANITANLLGDIFKANNSFFTTINDYFIFGNSTTSLEYIIDNYTRKNTLSNSDSYNKFSSYISDDANLHYYLNPGKTAETLKNSFSKSYNKQLNFNADSLLKFTAFSVQISSKKNLLINNICLFYDEDFKEDIKEEWYTPLDTNAILIPQFVNNHFTKDKIILVQDANNNLVAINPKGEILWTKQINSEIKGEINFIDAYKNNKYQALFNTETQLHLVDRNGQNVEGFPKNLPTPTKFGHSLFDYSNNKKYRICIVGEDNFIYNLDKKGRKVKGWKFTKNTNRITQKPIHFAVNGKDYILNATANTTTQLLARNGSARITFKDAHYFTNKVQLNIGGGLYAITTEGKLWTANTSGKTSLTELVDLSASSIILAHNSGYFVANENKLTFIKDLETFTLNLNSKINKIKAFGDVIAVSTSNKLFLVKDKEILEGFPIDSDGFYNISDIDNNGKLNIINIKNGLLYNYELGN